ncbi:glutathione S-transferase family protein [Maritimibacter dapengensis]|uniref:Glutathione S-transferase family protein n=1 Tax=Maritimibacter dapengensis TaxID=2836868 RepID=A0ABS6T385_9RHOB|nr:glutathione S-transferase family protein [Maritimibacter dapengensis]MBV7379719.1 glutathione S-transferase family protein [Maritimibacter dapengensis]
MLTLYHAYWSRATRMLALLHELDAVDQVRRVHIDIARQAGQGEFDARNPHPDHKVPTLVHDAAVITESAAIALYLTELFPEAGLAPSPGEADRGPFLTWLVYSVSVMEPVYNHHAAALDHPILRASFRGVPEVSQRLVDTFADGREYLLGDRFTAADLMVQSPFQWMRDWAPEDAKVQAWIDRVGSRPSQAWAQKIDAEHAPSDMETQA